MKQKKLIRYSSKDEMIFFEYRMGKKVWILARFDIFSKSFLGFNYFNANGIKLINAIKHLTEEEYQTISRNNQPKINIETTFSMKKEHIIKLFKKKLNEKI